MKNRDIEIKMLNEDVKGINKMTFTDKPECGIKGVFFTNNEKVKGGKRPNAGRKKKEPTTTVSTRVKVRHAEKLKEVIKAFKDSHD